MALTSRRTQRLLVFISKPLLAAVFLTLLFRWTTSSSSTSSSSSSKSKKPANPHPHLSRALIIASTTSSNLSWLDVALETTHWDPYIYITDLPSSSIPSHSSPIPSNSHLTVPVNKGNEAMPYLTYIIDHYDSLPDIMYFHHDHSQAWHQLFSSNYELHHLNPLIVLQKGYVSPRCLPGCENVIELSGDVVPLEDLRGRSRDVLISSVLHEFLGRRVPKRIAAPCCAQFAVSREAVLKRGLEEWRALREWLINTEVGSRESGRVLEYTWHLWFGMEDEFCPDEAQCLCDIYGVGDCGGEL